MRKREGFEGQIMYVIPRPMLKDMVRNVLLHQLLATDIGWFPKAKYHYRARPNGAPEHILKLCVDGEGWLEINGRHEIIKKNQAFLIPRNVPHIYGSSERDPWSVHWVHFVGTLSDFFPHLLPDGKFVISVDPQTTREMEDLFRESYKMFLGSFVWKRMVYVTQTLHLILGKLFFNNSSFSPVLRTSQFRNLDGTLDYLSNNIDKNISLKEMADQAKLSPSHFSRRFKEQTGFSPIDYFIHLKMQHAAMLLSFSDKNVKEISFELGYSDPYYFSRIFKRVIGYSPSVFRNLPQELG